MASRTSIIVLAGLLYTATSFAQTNPIEKAQAAYFAAQGLEKAFVEKSPAERGRSDYMKVINAYQRVYFITPQTGYADDALFTIARLYEEMGDIQSALKTLNFLIKDYPQTRFKREAEGKVARLRGAPLEKIAQRKEEIVPERVDKMTGPPTALPNEKKSPGVTASIDNLRYWETQNSVRVVVDVSGEINFKQGEAKDPDRMFIDVTPARLNAALASRQWPVKSGLLKQIRIGQYDNGTVRVVLDLGAIDRVSSFTLRDPDRLIIDVLGQSPSPVLPLLFPPALDQPGDRIAPISAITPPPVAALVKAVATPPPVKEPFPQPTPAPVTPAKPTNRGDRSLIRSLGLKISRVVIDAGHGGHDTGSIGPTGYTEKELVLDVARRLKERIEKEMGAEVVMTRTEDVFVPLEIRTEIANQQGADLFVSIHANSSRVKSVRGVETFFLNLPSSREALEIASRENAASQKTIHELQDVVRQIMLSDKVNESRELARHIQNAMAIRKDSGPNRGVKQAPFVVLIGANMPSILAEIAFISNPQVEKSIKTAQYRQSIAESLFDGVKSYAETLSGIKTAKSQDKN